MCGSDGPIHGREGKEMIYLDNAATTQMSSEVLEAMLPYMKEAYGNPSSSYALGREARNAVEVARSKIAMCIGAEPDEIIFTSGGTEADNLAINGFLNANPFLNMCITSTIEHKAIKTNKHAHQCFFCNTDGVIDVNNVNDYISTFKGGTSWLYLVSVMAVNNETGVRQPIEKIAEVSHEAGFIFHTDAVQAFGHIPINVKSMGIDMMSVSAHKINGPKGIGFLYKKRDVQLAKCFSGGGQEFGLRPGTENVAGIVGLAKAVELATEDIKEVNLGWFEDMLVDMCGAKINGVSCHDDPYKRIISCRFDDIHNGTLLQGLSDVGIYVSAGSACNSDSAEPSHVLKAMGLSDVECNQSIRISTDGNLSSTDAATVIKEINRIRREAKEVSDIVL